MQLLRTQIQTQSPDAFHIESKKNNKIQANVKWAEQHASHAQFMHITSQEEIEAKE